MCIRDSLYSGQHAQAKLGVPSFEPLAGQLPSHSIEECVAGIFNRLRHVERHGLGMVVAVERLPAVFELARAGDRGVRVNDTLFQRRDRAEYLKDVYKRQAHSR